MSLKLETFFSKGNITFYNVSNPNHPVFFYITSNMFSSLEDLAKYYIKSFPVQEQEYYIQNFAEAYHIGFSKLIRNKLKSYKNCKIIEGRYSTLEAIFAKQVSS
nr:hypothetical protein [Trentepohlia sp. YN1317]